jgi:hypothetical protein
MSFDHTSYRMIFRTRLTARWGQLKGLTPFHRHRHRLTASQMDDLLWLKRLLQMILWALLVLWAFSL